MTISSEQSPNRTESTTGAKPASPINAANVLLHAAEGDDDVMSQPPDSENTRGAAPGSGWSLADGWITTKVKSSFMSCGYVNSSDIAVHTENGVVTLSGKVDSGAERTLAIELATKVRGVRSVRSADLTL